MVEWHSVDFIINNRNRRTTRILYDVRICHNYFVFVEKMKYAVSTLAVALLCIFSASNVDARGTFVPRTSIKMNPAGFKKQTLDSTVALDDEPALLSPAGPETSLKARGGGYLTNQAMLSLTYYADIAWNFSLLIFMVFWLRSKTQFETGNYVDAFPNFNTMVLKDGFCINPTPKGPLGTLKLCGIADATLIIGSYLMFKDKLDIGMNKLLFLASAGYTVLHGAIHFFEVDQSGQIFSSDNSMFQNVLGVALLAVITAFTPIGINGTFNQVEKKGGLVVGVAAWVAFVLFYMFGIKEKVYALTYINVTIFLSIFGSRALLLKKKDPKRLEFYMGPSVLKTIIAVTANIAVMCFEPLACKDWFASVGGHVWFDVTLWLMLMSVMAE
jgi:hypothetical protein